MALYNSIGMSNQIGKTIYEQIATSKIAQEPFLNFFKAVKTSQLVTNDDGLQFRVKGDKFSGKIVIKLNGMDTYDIEFWDIRLSEGIIEKVDEINDVYNNQLLETLWNRIVIV